VIRRRIGQAARETFISFHVRNFRLFFVGQLISQVGNWLTLVALALFVLHLTGNGFAVGVLTAFQFVPLLFLGPWAGLVVDRSDKRRLLVIVQSLAMLQSFALAGLVLMGDPPLAAIYALAFVGGLTITFDGPARRSLVVEMVPKDHVQNAASLNTALMTGSRIVGPALAGALILTVGYSLCFAIDGLSYIAVIASLLMMRAAELNSTPRVTERAKGQVRAGFRYVRRVPEIWIPLVMAGIIGTFAFNFQVVLPLFVTRTFHAGAANFTLLFAVMSVGSFAAALVVARRRSVRLREVITGAFAFGVSMIVLAAAPSLGVAVVLGLALGASSATFMTRSTAITQIRAAPEMRGRVLALQGVVFFGSTPIGGPILGAVSDAFGPRAGILLGGVSAIAAAGWGFLEARKVGGAEELGRELHEPEGAVVFEDPLAAV